MREPLHTTTEGKDRPRAGWRAAVLAAAVGGMAVAVEDPALAQPEPPRFEVTVLERVEPRNGFRDDEYNIWSLGDDGTAYGTVSNLFRTRIKTIKSRAGEGTTWLLPRDPDRIELRPIAASTSGAVLLFTFGWPQNYIYIPRHGGRQLNNLHPDLFFPYDMNNAHTLVGQVGVQPNNRIVSYRIKSGFEFLYETESSALAINNAGSIVGHLESGMGWITIRIWHSDGRISTFELPRASTTPIGAVTINSPDEVVGMHKRLDAENNSRWAGWFWSDRTGLVEIPFRFEGPEGGFDVQIYGMSDDGWVLGEEHFLNSEGQDYFLWHVDAGFYSLGELYDWQGRFAYPADGPRGVVNTSGQMTVPTLSLSAGRTVQVFLDPLK